MTNKEMLSKETLSKETMNGEMLSRETMNREMADRETRNRETEDRIDKIREFFVQYEARFNEALREKPLDESTDEAKRTAGCFSDCLIAANPRGVSCGKNDEHFNSQILQGYQFYRSIGTKSMNISRMAITLLDELHAEAKVGWQSRYQRRDGRAISIDFNVIYFLQSLNGSLKIFAYITGDEENALRENGLI